MPLERPKPDRAVHERAKPGASGDGVVDIALRSVLGRIRSGEFAIGTRLPSQRDLARSLNVSRTTLREAISVLEAQGILRTEPVRGSFVLQAGPLTPTSEERLGISASSVGYTAADVYQYRYIVEPIAAMQAAVKSSENMISALRASIEDQKSAFSSGNMDIAVRRDIEFHDVILETAGNRLIMDIQETCRRVFTDSHLAPLRQRDRLWESVAEHERIVSAIAQRDPEGARYFMRFHIVRAAERYGIVLNEIS